MLSSTVSATIPSVNVLMTTTEQPTTSLLPVSLTVSMMSTRSLVRTPLAATEEKICLGWRPLAVSVPAPYRELVLLLLSNFSAFSALSLSSASFHFFFLLATCRDNVAQSGL